MSTTVSTVRLTLSGGVLVHVETFQTGFSDVFMFACVHLCDQY